MLSRKKLLGLNERYAFVSAWGDDSPFDPKLAAVDLLKVKTWPNLVAFLENHALNEDMAWFYESEGGHQAKWQFRHTLHFSCDEMGKELPCVLTSVDMPDYIDDELGIDEDHRVISIGELIHLRDTLRGLVLTASVAMGFHCPDGLVSIVNRGDRCKVDLIDHRSVATVNPAMAGYAYGGLLDLDMLTHNGYEDSDPSCSMFSDRFPSEGGLAFENRLYFDENSLTEEEAKRLACGLMTAASIDHLFTGSQNLKTLATPTTEEERESGSWFTLDHGFSIAAPTPPKPWWKSISNQVIDAISAGRIAICENCGTPFIAERKGARTCSGSCRTGQCIKRKAKPAR